MRSYDDDLAPLRAASLHRKLRTLESPQSPLVRIEGVDLINFSSNDYLGLANAEPVRAAFKQGIDLYGAGAGASRLVCGTLAPHAALERTLAAFKKTEAALKAAQAKVGTERGAIEPDVTVQQAVVTECAAARGQLIAALSDKGLVDTFARIAKVRGTAVARAEGERCTVCQVRLRPAVFVHVIKNDQIVQCDSCNRILYFIPPKPGAPAAPAAPDAPAQ